MDRNECIIFLTDKYGTKDRTTDISSISYDNLKKEWNISFVGDRRIFHYKRESIQVIRNCLKNKHSATVFAYLLRMAEFSDIQNDKGQNLLVRNLAKTRFISEKSVLARYLNPQNCSAKRSGNSTLIFPFGCNNSQFEAVSKAMKNSISIIQGPPGTGKTQTILNIIANLLINQKTVLVVSNNNNATANVYEKLSSDKYGFGFLCATQGNRQNIEDFLKNQQRFYPEYLKEWIAETTVASLDVETSSLKEYFEINERISLIQTELSAVEAEIKHFGIVTGPDIYDNTRLLRQSSSKLMDLLLNIRYTYAEKEKLGFFKKLFLKIKYGFGSEKFRMLEPEKLLETIRASYYVVKQKELIAELDEKRKFVKDFDPSEVYNKSLKALQLAVANKYSKKIERIQFKNWEEIYFNPEMFVREYPVVLSTTFSSRATVGEGVKFLFDYVIMDEASQVDVVTSALALSCAKNAVIVGDKMQLPNVIEENKKKMVQEVFSQTNLNPGYNFMNSFLVSLELVLPNTPQTLLREHYRCHPKIINFCNQQFYGGKLLIMTEDNGEPDVLKAIKTVPGDFCRNHCNQRQIDVIKEEILTEFSEYEKSNLGIITPYNNQVEAITTQIPHIDVATVHKYQGREKDNLIISTVDNKITEFADDSNMLNVAISRAKKKLTIVLSGNEHPKNSNLVALLKYIQYNNLEIVESKVCSIFDFFYSKENAAKLQFLKSSKKISKFDSENVMNALLTNIFTEQKYSRFGFVFEMPLKNVIDKNFFNQLPTELAEYANRSWSHVDFIIYNRVTKEILFGIEVDGYTYHKKGTKQAERDLKKNRIFELVELPLLRLSTKGANEEQKIKQQLNSYL